MIPLTTWLCPILLLFTARGCRFLCPFLQGSGPLALAFLEKLRFLASAADEYKNAWTLKRSKDTRIYSSLQRGVRWSFDGISEHAKPGKKP